jgi:hypothetical protein
MRTLQFSNDCLSCCPFRQAAPADAKNRAPGSVWPVFPNTLPPQDLNRSELGRVGCFGCFDWFEPEVGGKKNFDVTEPTQNVCL